jgi:hypothetical protein
VFASYHHDVTPADLAFSMAQYDGSILYTDKVLSDLIPAWEGAPRGRPRATVVLADHGEEFLDHGSLGTARRCNRELAHVPILVKAPGVRAGPARRAGRARRRASAGAGPRRAAVPGIARGRPYADWTTAEPTLYTESSDGITGLRWRWRLLERPLDHRGRAVLFDERADPRELAPLDDRTQIRDLQKRMDTIVAADAHVADTLRHPGAHAAGLRDHGAAARPRLRRQPLTEP